MELAGLRDAGKRGRRLPGAERLSVGHNRSQPVAGERSAGAPEADAA